MYHLPFEPIVTRLPYFPRVLGDRARHRADLRRQLGGRCHRSTRRDNGVEVYDRDPSPDLERAFPTAALDTTLCLALSGKDEGREEGFLYRPSGSNVVRRRAILEPLLRTNSDPCGGI